MCRVLVSPRFRGTLPGQQVAVVVVSVARCLGPDSLPNFGLSQAVFELELVTGGAVSGLEVPVPRAWEGGLVKGLPVAFYDMQSAHRKGAVTFSKRIQTYVHMATQVCAARGGECRLVRLRRVDHSDIDYLDARSRYF